MNLVEDLSRTLARIPPWLFTAVGCVALAVLLGWLTRRQLAQARRGSWISGRLREAQELYDTAVRFRCGGDREKALACMQRSLAIHEEIGANGEERSLIEQAIRELESGDAASSEEEP